MPSEPRLYRELASWWPRVSAPADYAEDRSAEMLAVSRALSGAE